MIQDCTANAWRGVLWESPVSAGPARGDLRELGDPTSRGGEDLPLASGFVVAQCGAENDVPRLKGLINQWCNTGWVNIPIAPRFDLNERGTASRPEC